MTRPLVIGHRGASGYRPEHTLAAYALAARMGADLIEPDLVITRDGVLVARHENEVSQTTDVARHPEFAARRTTKAIDGAVLTGWFTEDFTLAELKTLRARERIPRTRPRNTAFDGRSAIPTFQEVLDLRARLSRELGREVGVCPETKHPTYFRDVVGRPLEEPLVRALRRNGLGHRTSPVLVQSFEASSLEALRRALEVRTVRLLGTAVARAEVPAPPISPAGLRAIARHADAIGPARELIVPRTPAGASGTPTTLVDDAHRAGLLVLPYTFRVENEFLPLELRSSTDPAAAGDLPAELERVFALGVDGVFTDNPDIGVAVRDRVTGQ